MLAWGNIQVRRKEEGQSIQPLLPALTSRPASLPYHHCYFCARSCPDLPCLALHCPLACPICSSLPCPALPYPLPLSTGASCGPVWPGLDLAIQVTLAHWQLPAAQNTPNTQNITLHWPAAFPLHTFQSTQHTAGQITGPMVPCSLGVEWHTQLPHRW